MSAEETAQAIREAAVAHTPTLEVKSDALFDVLSILAVAAHGAIAAKADGDIPTMALSYGRVDGILSALALLGLPVPAAGADELLTQAEALMAMSKEEQAAALDEAENAVRGKLGLADEG